MNRLAAAVLLAALPAQAEVPTGHIHVGVGASVYKPLVSEQSNVWNPPGEPGKTPGSDLALSVELAFETTHAFVGSASRREDFSPRNRNSRSHRCAEASSLEAGTSVPTSRSAPDACR